MVEEQRCLGCDALLHEAGGRLVPISQEIRRGALVCARDLRQVAPPGRIDRKPFVAGSAQGSYPPTGLAIELGPGVRYALSEEQLSLRDLVLCTQAWCPDPDVAVGVFARHSSIDRADAHLGFELWPHKRQARIILRASVSSRAWTRDLVTWTDCPDVDPKGWNRVELRLQGSELQGFVNDVQVCGVHDATLGSGRVGLSISTSNSKVKATVHIARWWLWEVAP